MALNNILVQYSGYIIGAISLLFGFLKHRQKRLLELEIINLQKSIDDEASIRQKRYEVYREYLSKLDRINASITENLTSEELQRESALMFESIMSNPEDLAPFKNYMHKINQFSVQWNKQQNVLLEELNGLKLICSPDILELLDDYADSVKAYIDETVNLINSIDIQSNNFPDLMNADKLKALYNKMVSIKSKIQALMREDIGIASK